MRNKVIALVSNNIATDQRLIKVGSTLQNNCFDFHLVGTKHRGNPSLDHIPFKSSRTNIFFQKNFLFYAELQLRLLLALIKMPKKNSIILANDLDTLIPAKIVSKIYNLPLVVDFHEIFSEMPSLKEGSIQKRVWKLIETQLVPRVKYSYTVSNSYANWFNESYGIEPEIIKNVPKQQKAPVQTDKLEHKVVIYQGAINPSRGIDKMILSMQFLENTQLWIVGEGPLFEEYKALAKESEVEDKVQFYGKLTPIELKKITPKANLGLSLEEDDGLSYRYALPNKVFDYIQARIPMLGSSDLPEIKELIEKYNIGDLIENHHPEHIATKINSILEIDKQFFLTNLNLASKELNWENQEQKLVKIFKKAANG